MLRGLYAAATALDSAQQAHDVTAANLANSSTPGYKQLGARFETFNIVLGRTDPPPGDSVGTHLAATYTDFAPGPLVQTGHPYDLALADADQFFAIQGPTGVLFTRGGDFRRTPSGQLVTQAGYPLLGTNGPISFPRDALQVNVASDGSVTADGVPAGRIRLVRFADQSQLTPAGPTHYTAPPSAPPQDVAGRVSQGYREASNVNPAQAMVNMVIANRYHEAAQRALRAISESVQLNTRPQG